MKLILSKNGLKLNIELLIMTELSFPLAVSPLKHTWIVCSWATYSVFRSIQKYICQIRASCVMDTSIMDTCSMNTCILRNGYTLVRRTVYSTRYMGTRYDNIVQQFPICTCTLCTMPVLLCVFLLQSLCMHVIL